MSKILAVDTGYANVGLVVMEWMVSYEPPPKPQTGWRIIEMACIQTEKCDKRIALRKADDNARRIAEATRGIVDMIKRHDIKRMVAELPHTGGQSATAVRAMAYAGAMVIAVAECFDLAAEWYTPDETRAAGGVPKGMKGENAKKVVMQTMGAKYPELAEQFPTLGRREHVADALATFEAARTGVLVRTAAI